MQACQAYQTLPGLPDKDAQTADRAEVGVTGDQWELMLARERRDPQIIGRYRVPAAGLARWLGWGPGRGIRDILKPWQRRMS